jgi:DNA-binding NtrC family response regulator
MPPLLLVDPDRNFRQALAIALRLDGYTVETASTVEEALGIVARAPVGGCAADCLLPDVDRLFTQLEASSVPAVAVSNHPEFLREVTKRHPFLVTLEKPFRPAELATRLSSQGERVSQ